MNTSFSLRFGYTLIELLISVTLSLFLLLGVTEMFRHVGSTMSDTQKSLNMSANLNAAAMTLRSDLGKIDPKLAHQPYKMTQPGYGGDTPGYLEITDGMNVSNYTARLVGGSAATTPSSYQPATGSTQHQTGEHVPIWMVAKNSDPNSLDLTVGDVDDILAFTARAEAAYPFRGLINNTMSESLFAEIVWFVRGTNLYRRVLLLDDNNTNTQDQNQQRFYERNDISVHLDGTINANTMQDLSRREYRFAHTNQPSFPYLIGGRSANAWYYLRMPTLEEMAHPDWKLNWAMPGDNGMPDIGGITAANSIKYDSQSMNSIPSLRYYDFWEKPNSFNGVLNNGTATWKQDSKSGSISTFVSNLRVRAGEDIVLKNVISFDVKVWNPYWIPCVTTRNFNSNSASSMAWMWAPPQYIDLGQDRFILKDASGVDQECFVNYNQNLGATVTPTTLPNGIVIPPPPVDRRGIGFCAKGRYSNINPPSVNYGNSLLATKIDYSVIPPVITSGKLTTIGWASLSCVFDSWTVNYETEAPTLRSGVSLEPSITGIPPTNRVGIGVDTSFSGNTALTNADQWECPPPYSEDLQSIQITIRCFEPQSGNIKQVRVVHQF